MHRLIWNSKQTASVWIQINRCIVNTIWFRYDLIKFQKYFSVCSRHATFWWRKEAAVICVYESCWNEGTRKYCGALSQVMSSLPSNNVLNFDYHGWPYKSDIFWAMAVANSQICTISSSYREILEFATTIAQNIVVAIFWILEPNTGILNTPVAILEPF